MDDQFKIYIEQLRDGHVEKLDEVLSPDFIEVQEKELAFQDPVFLRGDAYLAEDMLILNLNVDTKAILLCSICNAPVKVDLSLQGVYHAEPLEQIKGAVFNFKEILRQMILLEVPRFAECGGKCPARNEIAKYLKEPSKDENSEEDEGYRPFADFDWDETKKKK